MVNDVTFSPDGELIASASAYKTIDLWKKDGTKLGTLQGHNKTVWGVVFSPKGDLIASGSGDYTVKLWRKTSTNSPNPKPSYTLWHTLKGHTKDVTQVAIAYNFLSECFALSEAFIRIHPLLLLSTSSNGLAL